MEASLEVLTDQDRTPSREPKLVRGGAAAIALNDDGKLNHGVVIFRESAVQAFSPERGELFAAIRIGLEQIRSR